MHADLDTLVIALYVTIDDLLGPRRGPGRKPRLSDAELVCLAVAQVLLGFDTERRWLRFAGRRLGHLFPYLPTPSAYNRRLRRAAVLVALALRDLAARTPSWWDELRLVDSTPVPCAASRETVKRSALAGHAGSGSCKSHHRYFWGFRLYVLAAPDGLPVAWCLATPKLGEREVVAAMLDHERPRLRPGLVIVADKGFAGQDFEQLVAGYGAVLLRPDRADEPRRHGSLGRWRQWIKSTFDTLKDQLSLERHRGPWPGWSSGSPNACSPWPRRSGGTGRPARPTSAPWSPTTTEPHPPNRKQSSSRWRRPGPRGRGGARPGSSRGGRPGSPRRPG